MRELEVLKKVVREAGMAAMEFYGEDYEVRQKEEDGRNPVTEADLAAEKVIFEGLADFGYPFLSEESVDDLKRLESERVWIVDPLDGTKDFIQQTGEFTVMVGLVEKGEVILGVVYQPSEDRLYFGVKGEGVFVEIGGEDERKVEAIQVSGREDFGEMRLLVSRNHLRELEKRIAGDLGIGEMVACGSAGLKMCLIAEGKAEIYINSSDRTFEWDVCAAEVILKEAGGVLLDLKGKEFVFNRKDPKNRDGYLACSGKGVERILEECG